MLSVAILAGGLATRLHPLTINTPKSLIPFNGKPFIEHQLQLLRDNGIEHVVICAGHLGSMIQDVVGTGQMSGLHVEYSFDEPDLLGTGGALKRASRFLESHFFVLYGDSYVLCDFHKVEEEFYDFDKKALMTVAPNPSHRHHSNVYFRDGFIWKYDKKKCLQSMKHFDYGLGVISRDSLDGFRDTFDLERAYQYWLICNELAGLEITDPVYEIGSLQGIKEFENYCKNK